MRASTLFLAAALALAALSSDASAQCYYIAPPRAPDLFNPATYYSNNYCQGVGPYHSVLPPFPPFQGMIFPGGVGGAGGHGGAGFGGAGFGGAGFGGAGFGGAAGGSPFGTHPFARSPRDFFMYDTNPSRSPYNYGPISPIGLPR